MSAWPHFHNGVAAGLRIADFSQVITYVTLTHISLASFLWDIGKQCKTISDVKNSASDQVLHCRLIEVSFKFE